MCPPEDLTAGVRIQHKVYGNQFATLEVQLKEVLDYFEANAFDTYIGFERTGEGRLMGTLVFRNQTMDYNHLMILYDIGRLVTAQQRTLEADLYTFIRSDNVHTLYGSYLDRKGERLPVQVNEE